MKFDHDKLWIGVLAGGIVTTVVTLGCVLILALWPITVHPQPLPDVNTNPCGLPASAPRFPYIDMTGLNAQFQCAPWPKGTGTIPKAVANSAGITAWWYCPYTDGTWGPNVSVVTTAKLTDATFIPQLLTDLAASSDVVTLSAVAKGRISTPMNAPELAAAWCPVWPQIWAGIPPPPASPDGTLVPPAPSLLDVQGVRWSIRADAIVLRNDVATNGHATTILIRGGSIYVQSPTGGFWWQWIGPNSWRKLTTVMP